MLIYWWASLRRWPSIILTLGQRAVCSVLPVTRNVDSISDRSFIYELFDRFSRFSPCFGCGLSETDCAARSLLSPTWCPVHIAPSDTLSAPRQVKSTVKCRQQRFRPFCAHGHSLNCWPNETYFVKIKVLSKVEHKINLKNVYCKFWICIVLVDYHIISVW